MAVSARGRVTSGSPGCYDDAHGVAWAAAAAAVHDAGSRLAMRLSHAGRRGSMRPRDRGLDRPLREGAWTTVAPTALPYDTTVPAPSALDERTLAGVRDDFVAAARRAGDAGVDVLLLDLSDGYLLASFLSPLTNQRTDRLGGDLEARMRCPLDVLAAVQDVWPSDRPLGVRLTVDDRVAGGNGPAEGVAVAAALAAAGVALIDAVGGHTVATGGAAYRRAFQADLADRVRNQTGVPAVASGAITTLDQIDTLVAAGRADLCVLDPERYLRPVSRPASRPDATDHPIRGVPT